MDGRGKTGHRYRPRIVPRYASVRRAKRIHRNPDYVFAAAAAISISRQSGPKGAYIRLLATRRLLSRNLFNALSLDLSLSLRLENFRLAVRSLVRWRRENILLSSEEEEEEEEEARETWFPSIGSDL